MGLTSGGVGSEAVFCLAVHAAHVHTFDQEIELRAASEMTFGWRALQQSGSQSLK